MSGSKPRGRMVAQHVCETCGRAFERHDRRPRRFCSRACWCARPTVPMSVRVWWHVDKSGGDVACWPWTASTTDGGYGQLKSDGRRAQRAHVAAWISTNGAIPKETPCVLHRCDNPPCCNPAHLFLGTHKDNAVDKVAKGRHTYGSGHGSSRLTEADVARARAMRYLGMLYREIGAALGVCEGTIRYALGRGWRHVA